MMLSTAITLASNDWLYEFRPRTTSYRLTVAISAALIAAVIVLGRRLRNSHRQRYLEHALGWSTIAVQLFALVWRNMPGNFDLQEALPLQLCRVVAWACAIAMITRSRWALALTFFWGLGLSSMGFITPVIRTGPATVNFWLFWIAHIQIVGIALYQIIVHGYGPSRKDWILAAVASLVYVAIVIPINLALSVDYGFLGASVYDKSTLAGHLGRFPARAVKIILFAQVWMFALYLVARGVGALKQRHSPLVA